MQPLFYLTIVMAAVSMSPAAGIPINAPETVGNSTPCSIEMERICSTIDVTDSYSMRLGMDKFHRYGEIKVQVYATQCTLGDAHLPWWYQVEVIDNNLDSGSGEHEVGDAGSGDGLRGVGRFSVPRRQHELALCNQGSTVVFSSCSPTLLDLPKEITWLSSNKYDDTDSLCFRLTVQQSGDSSCSRKEVCISIGDIPRPTQSSPNTGVSGSSQDDTTTYVQIVADALVGSADLRAFEHVIDDEDMLQVIKDIYNIDDTELGVVIPSNKGCLLAQEFYSKNRFDWIPDCTCDGSYKTIQCADVEGDRQCWCSSPAGSEIHNSRKTLNCTDPSSFDFKC